MIGERAATLAMNLEAANGEVIAFAEGCPAGRWTVPCVDDGRTVAAVARHVGGAYSAHRQMILAIAAGEPMPAMFTDWDTIHQGNAISATKYANADRGETVESLRRNGANLATAIRALANEQLDRTVPVSIFSSSPLSVEQIVANIVVEHPRGHLVGLRATVADEG